MKVKMLKLKKMEENNDRERKQLENDIEKREKKLEEEARMSKIPSFHVQKSGKTMNKPHLELDLIESGNPKTASLEFEVGRESLNS